jgi:hypothetical protein
MNRTVTKGILTVVASLATTAMLAAPAAAWGWRHQTCLAPNGSDDTAEIQAALERCSGARRRCVVSLCAGVFPIAQVRVRDFQGVLRGAGRGKTVIQALPNLEVNANPDGYFMDDPFHEDLAPWPVLVQFIGGKGRIHDLTVKVPTPELVGDRPTTGWGRILNEDWEEEKIHELDVAILITGEDPVDFEVKRVEVVAGDDELSDLRTTLLNGITFEGRLFNEDDPGIYPVFPLRGRFRLSDSELVGMLSGAGVAELQHARVTIKNNRYWSEVATYVQDVDRSRVRILNNHWEAEGFGLQVYLNTDGEPSEKNSFLILGNQGSTVVPDPDLLEYGAGRGIFFIDPGGLDRPEPGGSVVSLAHNDISVRTVDGPALSGIEVHGAGRLWAWKNVVRGEASLGGISVDRTTGCWLVRNALETTGGSDLVLGRDTSRCLAVVGHDDIVDDYGTDNWIFFR